jgi:hypothetical protein
MSIRIFSIIKLSHDLVKFDITVSVFPPLHDLVKQSIKFVLDCSSLLLQLLIDKLCPVLMLLGL